MTFGWDYPPGALNDPRAPYNAADAPERCTAVLGPGIRCNDDTGHTGEHRAIVGGIHHYWNSDEYEADEC